MIYEATHAEGKYWRVEDATGEPIKHVFSADSGTGELVRFAMDPDHENRALIEFRDGERQIKKESVFPDHWRIVHKQTGDTVATWPPA